MSTREWGQGYDEGYQQGWNDAMDEKPAEASDPVAYIEHHKAGDNLVLDSPGANSSPLYTSPPPCPTCEALARTVMLDQTSHDAQRKPLTLQERTRIVRANKMYHDKGEIDAYGVIDDVEAAHGIGEKK